MSPIEVAIRELLADGIARKSREIAEGVGYSQKAVIARLAMMEDICVQRTQKEGCAKVPYYMLGKDGPIRIENLSPAVQFIVRYSVPKMEEHRV